MSKESGMIKVPRKNPQFDPATATPEEIIACEKMLEKLRERDHEIRIRNAYFEFFTDARLRIEKGER